MTKPLIKGWKAVSSLIILTLTTAILFYWISSVLKPKSQNLSGNYPPSPLVDVIAQYKKANPEIPFPRDYVNQCARPQNPVVAENCRQGDEEWVIRKNSFDILGFASSTSVNKGETIQFFIDTPSPRFDLSIFRLGFYRGKGGRLLETIPDILGKKQPPCRVNYQTGLTSCSNWALSFNLNIPASWISGIYLAKMVQKDTGGENYILFVVRDDDSHSDMLYQ